MIYIYVNDLIQFLFLVKHNDYCFMEHNNKLTALINNRLDKRLVVALEFRYYCQSHMLHHFFKFFSHQIEHVL